MTLIRGVCWLQRVSVRIPAPLRRCYSSDKLRNIGILAHIDAGKTTTTERMLFYSGKTRSLGEVHRGNTVTDCLTQERERGITICSSAVAFSWHNHKINLLDTPGHIDFTMEVEQSLHAVDGVVVVLDGTAGVEAQTNTVWTQAEKHRLPKLVFVNKMDRPDADYDACVDDLTQKLDANPICLQLPLKDANNNLTILDVISLQSFSWNAETLGRDYIAQQIDASDAQLSRLHELRYKLIDTLSGIDDELANVVITNEGFDKVSDDLIRRALRRAVNQCKVVPVLLGSAYKNVGVQLLMDAIIDYLPAPNDRNNIYNSFGSDFVGKVFKIVHDKQRGALTLVRVYSGELKKNARLISARNSAETVTKIYEPLADEYREISGALAGDVAICAGLKNTVTGDLLTSSAAALKNAQKRLKNAEYTNEEKRDETNEVDSTLVNEVFASDTQIPDAVYFCSIEPPSLATQNAMELALKQLQREDPSLRVHFDPVTGQTVLGGMGELHMDIVKSRILSEYKIDVELGPLQIAYKETIERPALDSLHIEKEIAGIKQSISITLELLREQSEIFSLDKSGENAVNLNAIRPRTLQVIRKGALSALERGPRVGGQVVETQIRLHSVTIGRGTADSFVMAATAQCVQKIMSAAGTRLLEPVMSIEIIVPSERVSAILADLARRRAAVNDVRPRGDKNKLISANAPLAELSGYSSILRTISSGTASMTMQPCGFASMNVNDEVRAIKRAQGLE